MVEAEGEKEEACVMPSLNFQPRFAALVEAGAKRQTIRPLGKRTIKPGDRLVFYTGLRRPEARKLGEAMCKQTLPITMDLIAYPERLCIRIEGAKISLPMMEQLAEWDGFADLAEFLACFEDMHGPRFEGTVIRW